MNIHTTFDELCYWCRVGDVQNVDRIISTGVNVNDEDEFDNSPLFLASLCGHEELVRLLLKRGAVCDRDRYEGARCIYGALTDSIRNILLRFDISKAVDVKQPFATHISFQLREQTIRSHDITFSFQKNKSLKLHRFLLAARSSYFERKLLGAWWGRKVIEMPDTTSISAFETISRFLYLVPILHDIGPSDYTTLRKFCQKLGLSELSGFLDKVYHVVDPLERARLMTDYQLRFTKTAQENMTIFLREKIIGQRKSIQFKNLPEKQIMHETFAFSAFPDIYVFVSTGSDVRNGWMYPCHKAILSRCEYFRAMFSSQFWEATSQYVLQDATDASKPLAFVTLLTEDTDVAELILAYLYYDRTDIPWHLSLGVLRAADALLIERLKTMAAISICQSKEFLKDHSIFDVLYVAWETRVERLEHYAAEVIAGNLRYYCVEEEFKNAILRSSQRIQAREETDTIELIDDIRYYLLKRYNLDAEDIESLDSEVDIEIMANSDVISFKRDLEVIDDLLADLDLEA